MQTKIGIRVAGAIAVTWLIAPSAQAASYYISASTGNDANNGLTPATAWQSISKINNVTFATSDRVYLKAGDTWTASGGASFNLDWSGTAASHAIIAAYHTDASGNPVAGTGSAARPKIVSAHVFGTIGVTLGPDGQPITSNGNNVWVPGVYITGSHVEFRDVETVNFGEGLKVEGNADVIVDNVKTSSPYECGMALDSVDTITVSNSEVVGDDTGYGVYKDAALRWCSGINIQYTTHATISGNFVHEGWGEGINAFRASKMLEVAGNIVFATRAWGIYAGWAQSLRIHGNVVLGTSNSAYFRNPPGNAPGPGIGFSNEDVELTQGKVTAADALQDVAVYDNLVAGMADGFTIQHTASPPATGGALLNVTVYNNTFVDNNTQISPAKCTGCIAENNISLSLSTGTGDTGTDNGGFAFHNNYWSRGVPATGFADAATDVYSGLTLAKMSGWRSLANAASLPTWTAFVPLSGSSTFRQGTALLPAPYNLDYNGSPHRNPMDLGALAGSGGVVAPLAAFSCTPLSGTAPLSITCTDVSTNSPTSWSWKFGDGSSSTTHNPTHSYSAAGTYTVALTATNSGGSNTLTKTGYVTVSASGSGGSVTPNPVTRGQTITISDTFAATMTDASADIVYWVKDTSSNLLGRCGSTSTSITSGQPKTLSCTLTIPTSAATGTYNVSGTVYHSASDQTVIQGLPVFATFTIN
jgi:PKD repeat protein